MNQKEQLLAELHDLLVDDLLRKLKTGEATAAEMRVAMSLLTHNGITTDDIEDLKNATVQFNPEDIQGLELKDLKVVGRG